MAVEVLTQLSILHPSLCILTTHMAACAMPSPSSRPLKTFVPLPEKHFKGPI